VIVSLYFVWETIPIVTVLLLFVKITSISGNMRQRVYSREPVQSASFRKKHGNHLRISSMSLETNVLDPTSNFTSDIGHNYNNNNNSNLNIPGEGLTLLPYRSSLDYSRLYNVHKNH